MSRRVGLAVLAALLAVPRGGVAADYVVQLRASDGTTLAGTFYPGAAGGPAIVLVHMLTRSRDDWRGLAERLQRAGAAVLAVDLRGHGASSGAATPSTAMGLDVQAAVIWLSARGEVGQGAIGIVGASFGATAAILAAAELPAVRAVALVSPAADYRGVRLDPGVRKYGTRPLLVVSSTEDPYALRTVRGLVAGDASSRQLRLSPVAGHGTQLLTRDPDLTAALVDWLRQTLLF